MAPRGGARVSMFQRRAGIIASSAVTASAPTWHTVFPWSYSWLADDLSDGPVSSWTPGTGGQPLVQASGSAQPIRAATTGPNGQPAVTFDGGDDTLSGAVDVRQPNTIVIIGRRVSGSPSYLLAPDQALGVTSTGRWQFRANGGFVGSAASDANWHALTLVYDAASSRLVVDGGTVLAGNPGSGGASALWLGSNAGSLPMACEVAAIGIVSGDATTRPEWAALAGLIASKWGLVA